MEASAPGWPAHVEHRVREAAPHTAPFGCVVHTHDTVTSTNDLAGRLAAEGCPEGALVVAAAQTRGRGRRGRAFASPRGSGLYCSAVLRPATWPSVRRDPQGVGRVITLMAGVATAEALRRLGATGAELKWPNDVIARVGNGGPWRKLAGILTEASSDAAGLQHVVVGIGINVTATPPDADLASVATSLAALVTPVPAPDVVLLTLLERLAAVRTLLAHDGARPIVEAWRTRAPSMRERTVTWMAGPVRRTGRPTAIDDQGALCVETAEGVVQVTAGELTWMDADG